ncbi:hypothetical protein PNK_p0050 (plasmid) [Candidatus Protochlamydia naegleriophila]|uniref:Uncharacterized protein n=1 Tax=Candidatus Protochlamydia naegleriophila TaxID=389348 RepID=A0A0U5JDZ5_9BACT|nr:hypothetical protein [Candidatus Protochlamydia naegleriophila]CUI18104.1 hypothetical protein PNK_p0050 [Candidatus Protochlamydia naegleriophila]
MLKFLYKNEFIKLIIEEDVIGFYLIVYKDPYSETSNQDYLTDSLEDAFQKSEEGFGITKENWVSQNISLQT